jgi:glycosyltransferase involved in cell wall biosynthesis
VKIIQDIQMALIYSGGKAGRLPAYIKDSLEYIDCFVVPSEFVRDSLVSIGIKRNKITIIPFGVDVGKFGPIKRAGSSVFKAAFSGNVNNRKGIPYLIQAWKELGLKDAELNLYGRVYPEIRKCLKDSEKFGIKVHGFIKLEKELPKNDIFVFPSLLEGSAKSLYEAMACGLPVVTTYNAGSVVRNGKEGFIIPVQDVEAIRKKILYFYDNRKQIKKMGRAARKLAEKYTWERYAATVSNLCEHVYGDPV